MAGALDGIQVLDFSEGIAGGYCTKLLAGLGAEVIKVERPFSGDSIRSMPPYKDDVADVETSTVHLHLGMGKKSVTLSLDTADGRELAHKLIERADVVVTSARAGTLTEWGLTYEELSAARPELIMTSITPFGLTGPYADFQGSELIEYSAGGYTYLTGLPEREPIKCGGSQAEYQGGLHGATGTMAALLMRQLTERGDLIDVSITEAICFTHAGMSPFLNTGEIYGRVGARLLSKLPTAPYPSTILPCNDGFVHVHWSPSNPPDLGVLIENPRISEPEVWKAPRGHAEEIDAAVTEWLRDKKRYEIVRQAQEMRLPFTEVLTPGDLLDDPQFVAREFFVELNHPVAGAFKHLGAPFLMTGTPYQSERAPLLGEHNGEIYGSLGLTPAEIAMLRSTGAL
jgi:CoA:oxalate CoA-transferase